MISHAWRVETVWLFWKWTLKVEVTLSVWVLQHIMTMNSHCEECEGERVLYSVRLHDPCVSRNDRLIKPGRVLQWRLQCVCIIDIVWIKPVRMCDWLKDFCSEDFSVSVSLILSWSSLWECVSGWKIFAVKTAECVHHWYCPAVGIVTMLADPTLLLTDLYCVYLLTVIYWLLNPWHLLSEWRAAL